MTASTLKPANTIDNRPSRTEAEAAVRTLLEYIGEDPDREGLVDTPKRVISSYAEFFEGYKQDPVEILSRTFEDVGGYDDIVLLKNMRLESHCEHHMVPIIGKAHIAYLPNKRVVGISKLARLLDIFGRRLQTQETMTKQIADAIEEALEPKGIAIVVDAYHQCMTTRGVRKPETSTVTQVMRGVFKDDPDTEKRFYTLIDQ